MLRLLWFLLPFLPVAALVYGAGELEARLDDPLLSGLVALARPFLAVAGALGGWALIDREGFGALRRSFSFAY